LISKSSPVLVLGARSDIARAIAIEYAKLGHPLMLSGRTASDLERDAEDIRIRHEAEVSTHACDVTDLTGHDAFIDSLGAVPGIVVCAVGLLGDQDKDAGDTEATLRIFAANFTGPVLVLEKLAARMAATGSESAILGIGSVAGDRGRARNYVYGSAKAGFAAYMSGLRQKYAASKLQVMTVKPGFVRTAMTAGMETPAPLTTDPEPFAARVVKAQRAGGLVYYDLRWRVLMTVIKLMPEGIFKKMKF